MWVAASWMHLALEHEMIGRFKDVVDVFLLYALNSEMLLVFWTRAVWRIAAALQHLAEIVVN